MKDISFFSEDNYLYLPSMKHPKVILAVGNRTVAKNAFKLYNPFSYKAKSLKIISQFLFINFNALIRFLIVTKSHKKSEFIEYLENRFNTQFTVSVYYSTEKDKVVLQLQSNNSIFGYLKFPINKLGVINLNIEKDAIKLLSKKEIVEPFILSATYGNIPFLITPQLKGKIGIPAENDIENLVSQLKKESKHKLIDHPRIKGLYYDLEKLQLESYRLQMDLILANSAEYYYEAFEHGDFAPWNIIKTHKGLVPFDFEFFIKNGIEYFDLIKYHFQVGRLLKKKSPVPLSNYIFNKIKTKNIESLVALFLIKEIITLERTNESHQFHDNMLNFICE
ncbi:hypothetical protein A8C32_14795 [Flavivirga aquatica]|uniref:Aminoglycoside phosphotransferase domain-containing protein n=1 Tax=Flavivirga aquatica TaxID=1849968 RepID=A0A1E5T8X5_9FLAO|nr:hypothetical protein [Flavivirga aquatica]OEK07757.1 hypothetical protein A8C32_14795 [Flavivirga aquatica]